jgi:hypothetical protein
VASQSLHLRKVRKADICEFRSPVLGKFFVFQIEEDEYYARHGVRGNGGFVFRSEYSYLSIDSSHFEKPQMAWCVARA